MFGKKKHSLPFNRRAKKRCFLVPSALRAPAPG
jgi:hypothetical protein